ncbi:hypothetical protein M405DRAFT_689170, partial [Rhizopogon salebrosus TDB-379]
SSFMCLPSDQERRDCHSRFIDATGSQALAQGICAVCARECGAMDEKLTSWRFSDIPNGHRLIPAQSHPAHDLFDRMLLDPAGKTAGQRHAENLQRSMRGNVSTFALSMEGVADMIEGRLMPRPPRILASLISVTFVSIGQLQKKSLYSMFRVRRQAVYNALKWLKEHNTAYYGDVEISTERIMQLPDDDIPDEILHGVRQCTDSGVVDQESDGYVPIYKEDNVEAGSDSDDLPSVIPLQATGTIDTDLTNISGHELMSWGLHNLWANGTEGEYAVKHGSNPVRDFRQPKDTAQADIHGPLNLFERAFPCLFPYGHGGMEGRQGRLVDLSEHVKWALRYHDRRFRTHETFPFYAFGILQRRQALHSARIQIQR